MNNLKAEVMNQGTINVAIAGPIGAVDICFVLSSVSEM